MKVSTRLYLGFGVIVAIAIITQIIIALSITGAQASLQEFDRLEAGLRGLGDDMRYYDAVLTDTVRGIILEPEDQNLRRAYDENAQLLDAAILAAKELAIAPQDNQALEELTAINGQMIEIENQILQNAAIQDVRHLIRGTYSELKSRYSELLAEFHDRQTQNYINRQAQIQDNLTNLRRISVTLGVILALLAGGIAFFLSRNISKALAALMEGAAAVGRGDLSKRVVVTSKDELGMLAGTFNQMAANLESTMATQVAKDYIEGVISEYRQFVAKVSDGDLTVALQLNSSGKNDDLYDLGIYLNNMVQNLSEMASQIGATASSISASAAEILASTTQQIASTTEQEAAVTQTMATVEEVKTTVRQTSERAQNVAEVSRQSVQTSLNGQNSVTDSVNGMKLIRERVESIAENILMLSERTQQIGEIIDTVNEIAAQSKLLALNASIEAARAGEDGKGFAVVAMEVRQLAEQSREATARVRDILNQIQQATNTAVMVTEEGSKGAEMGMALVERAGESIEALSQTIEEASQAAIQIAASTNQQNNGMEQLAMAMLAIKQASAQTSASTRQAERSAKDLNEMALRMQQAVSRYRLKA